jgi:hypothetical protein
MSFASQVLSSYRPTIVPFATSLSPGEYWMATIMSSNTGSTNQSLQNIVNAPPGVLYFTTNAASYAEIGNTQTIGTSNVKQGWGSYSASSQTNNTIPMNQISLGQPAERWFNMMAVTK